MTKILYVPLVGSCMDPIPVVPGERGGLSSGVRFRIRPRLDGNGNIVFAGALDRFLKAYRDSTGKVLWQTRLNDVPSSCFISYSVNGSWFPISGILRAGALRFGYSNCRTGNKQDSDRRKSNAL
jgi:hypothetical protein